mmetsp:Transcript_728/g.1689  ORF Transcript_728/g.1689 Transcript_728/m.1689 type:complete len:223 (-) Transcript_728:1076-1744(-)
MASAASVGNNTQDTYNRATNYRSCPQQHVHQTRSTMSFRCDRYDSNHLQCAAKCGHTKRRQPAWRSYEALSSSVHLVWAVFPRNHINHIPVNRENCGIGKFVTKVSCVEKVLFVIVHVGIFMRCADRCVRRRHTIHYRRHSRARKVFVKVLSTKRSWQDPPTRSRCDTPARGCHLTAASTLSNRWVACAEDNAPRAALKSTGDVSTFLHIWGEVSCAHRSPA